MSIKQVLLIIGFLYGAATAQTTTTITGTLKDLTNAVVTSGKVTFTLRPSADTTISGVARFSPQTVTCPLNGSGLIKAQDGVSTCTITMTTALQPPGNYYLTCYWPYNVKTACFTFYAVLSTYDWSTVVPTPTTSPAQNFVDIFSNQMIAGNKTFSSTLGLPGGQPLLSPITTGTDSGTETLQNKTLTGAGSGNAVTIPAGCGFQGIQPQLTDNSTDQTMFSCALPGNTVQNAKGFRVRVEWQHDFGTAAITYKFWLGATLVSSQGVTNNATSQHAWGWTSFNSTAQTTQTNFFDAFIVGGALPINPTANTTSTNLANSQVIKLTFNAANNTDKVTPQFFVSELIQ